MMRVMWLLVSCLLITCTSSASAHESQPGTLEIKQLAANRYDVAWKDDGNQNHHLALEVSSNEKRV